jgi:hypothetical protein
MVETVDDVSIDDDPIVFVPCDCWNPHITKLIPEVPHFPLDDVWVIGAAFIEANMRWWTQT